MTLVGEIGEGNLQNEPNPSRSSIYAAVLESGCGPEGEVFEYPLTSRLSRVKLTPAAHLEFFSVVTQSSSWSPPAIVPAFCT
jgi:hypothetical protein